MKATGQREKNVETVDRRIDAGRVPRLRGSWLRMMLSMMASDRSTVADLFGAAGLSPVGPVRWGEPCAEDRPGVYIVTADRAIVYVGRTRRAIAKRLKEFYQHKYGDRRPHRGGQEVLRIPGVRLVYWCPTDDPRVAEARMLRAFERRYGRLPFANRRRGDQAPKRRSKAAAKVD